jgi:hypothetical protein
VGPFAGTAKELRFPRFAEVVVEVEAGLSQLGKPRAEVDHQAVGSRHHVDRTLVRAMVCYFAVCYVFCWCAQFYLQHRSDPMDTAATLTGASAWQIARIISSAIGKAFDQAFPPDAE